MEDCVCVSGFYRVTTNGTVLCEECEPGYYCFNETKLSCPWSSSSNIRSSTLEDCKCERGSSGPDGGDCVACVAGKFKTETGSGACTSCPANTYSDAEGATTLDTCQACGEGRESPPGSGLSSECVSTAGWYTSGSGVHRCDPGTYQSKSNQTACQACDTGEEVTHLIWTQWVRVEQVSAAGSSSISDCKQCPASSTAPPTATTINACECDPGHKTLSWSPPTCQPCQQGTIQPARNQTLCSTCDVVSYAPAAATACLSCPARSSTASTQAGAITDCFCDNGYAGSPPDGQVCVACGRGFIQDGTDPSTCRPCEAGTYTRSDTAAEACEACMPNSHSESGSFSISSCSCNAGFQRYNNDSHCQACARGQYNAQQNSSCLPCPLHAFSNQLASTQCQDCPPLSSHGFLGATSIDDCLCDAGASRGGTQGTAQGTAQGGAHCALCEAGKFKSALGTAPCEECPIDTFSGVGATACTSCHAQSSTLGAVMRTSVGECLCLAGYASVSATECQACEPGSAKGAGNEACSPCGRGNVSSADASTCEQCPANTYQDSVMAVDCQTCPLFTASHDGSRAASDCFCVKGFTREVAQGPCTACDLGKYRDWEAPGQDPLCELCPPGTTTGGEGASLASECTACPPDTYTNDNERVCSPCEENAQSPPSSVSSDACQCNAGYTASGSACVPCDIGTYKTNVGDNECTSCAPGSVWIPVAVRISTEDSCRLCPGNTYQTDSSTCTACTPHSSSTPGSTRVEDCLCDPGYYLAAGLCVACAPGTYKSGSSNNACVQCPGNTFYPGLAANASSDCRECQIHSRTDPSHTKCDCIQGYAHSNASTCIACVEGTFTTDIAQTECEICPAATYFEGAPPFAYDGCVNCLDFSHSPAGSYGIERCVCDAGYHRVFVETPENPLVVSPNCSLCREHHYCPDQATEAPCPSSSRSPPGSESLANCSCAPGFFGPPEACVRCAVNTYCEGGREYTHCPLNSTTHGLQQRNSSRDCECLPGFYRVDDGCEECLPGSFCFDETMFRCPRNASSPKGSSRCSCDPGFRATATETSALECEECPLQVVCHGGERGVEVCAVGAMNRGGACVCAEGSACNSLLSCSGGGACNPCPENMYCSMNNATRCPPRSSSPANSSSVLACVCDAGHYRVNDECVACEVGSWCHEQERHLCVDFDARLVGTRPLLTTREEACVCERGYFRTSQYDTCKPCPLDYWCPLETLTTLPNVHACMKYGYTVAPASHSFEQCFCEAGLKFSASDMTMSCIPCAQGERCQDGEVVEALCHLQDRTADADHSKCVCLPGFWEDATRTCTPCLPGTVKPGAGNGACVSCPANSIPLNTTHCVPCPSLSTAGPGSTECTCEWPLFWTGSIASIPSTASNGSTCAPCGVDQYFKHTQATNDASLACHRCPPRSDTRNTSGNAGLAACRCLAGYVRGSQETDDFCEPCPEATYEEGGVCRSCGAGAHSLAASSSAEACSCNVSQCQQYVWNDDCFGSCEEPPPPCSPCEPGHQKETVSPVGNTEACKRCEVHTYQPAPASVSCIPCHETRQNLHPAMTDVTACVCRVGYEPVPGTNASEACAPCLLGYFKDVAGNNPCTPCPVGQFSNATGRSACIFCAHVVEELGVIGATTTPESASTTIANCTCLPGHYRDRGLCAACVPGTYKPDKSFEACRRCGAGSAKHRYGKNESEAVNMDEHCLQCPAYAGNNESLVEEGGLLVDSISKCLCFAGHDTWSVSQCEPCGNYTYKIGFSNEDCRSCSPNEYYVDIITPCAACSLPSHNPEGGTHSLAVNARDTSQRWGEGEGDCTCRVGYERIQDTCYQCATGHYRGTPELDAGVRFCTRCPPDTFQNSVQSQECIQCPANSSFSGTGASSAEQCLCHDGYYWLDGACASCPAGTWKKWSADMSRWENLAACTPCAPDTYSLGTASECTPCAANMFSIVGADSFGKCFCNAGFGVALDPEACEPCPNATYWRGDAVPRQQCSPCPQSKTSPVGSAGEADCRCVPGHGIEPDAPPSAPCLPCTSGSFALGGNQPCESCGWGTVTEPPEAAAGPESCLCDTGRGLIEIH